jgi:hypothetical protein
MKRHHSRAHEATGGGPPDEQAALFAGHAVY